MSKVGNYLPGIAKLATSVVPQLKPFAPIADALVTNQVGQRWRPENNVQ